MTTTREDHPIPIGLNLLLSGLVFLAALILLRLASQTASTTLVILSGVLYSFLLLTGYALLHEASHRLLHPDARINDRLGMALGWLFPVAFTLLRVSHSVHHRYNRTDHEMFDCYYPGDCRLVKRVQWYGILTGIWWTLIPVGSLLLALAPSWLRSPPFRRARSTAILFDDYGPAEMRRLRLEVAVGIIVWIAAFRLLDLRWEALTVLYACFAVNWSSRQYVAHAFTVRDVRNGALNLRVGRLMAALLLNGQWDGAHHRHPRVPWSHLPRLGERCDRGYWRQYLTQWRGPRPCTSAAPSPLTHRAYEALS